MEYSEHEGLARCVVEELTGAAKHENKVANTQMEDGKFEYADIAGVVKLTKAISIGESDNSRQSCVRFTEYR